ncbi:hypothetical protein LXL04_037345 [Taraxacum kok-saghyz]
MVDMKEFAVGNVAVSLVSNMEGNSCSTNSTCRECGRKNEVIGSSTRKFEWKIDRANLNERHLDNSFAFGGRAGQNHEDFKWIAVDRPVSVGGKQRCTISRDRGGVKALIGAVKKEMRFDNISLVHSQLMKCEAIMEKKVASGILRKGKDKGPSGHVLKKLACDKCIVPPAPSFITSFCLQRQRLKTASPSGVNQQQLVSELVFCYRQIMSSSSTYNPKSTSS